MANHQPPIVPPGEPAPVSPTVMPSLALPAPPPQPTRADARSSHAARVRAAVREQLAHSQRRRQELSHALGVLRRDLREFRGQVRTRLRQISHEAATRRAASAKPAAAPRIVAPEPLVAPAPPAIAPAAGKAEQR